jgi:Tol biopolymer transport system component
VGFWAQWSPNGEWIVFAGGDHVIYKIRPDGTEQQALTSHPQLSDVPQWSPDGEWILFLDYVQNGEEIRRMRADGSQQELLVKTENYSIPSYSPPIRSDWHPWRSIAAGIGLISLAIFPWRRLRILAGNPVDSR